MFSVLGSIVTPAVVASLFSIFFGARAEKRRELRKAILDRLQESRGLVKHAIDAASQYYSKAASDRTAAIEANLWLAEREVRMSLSSLTERSDAGLEKELKNLQRDFDIFISELTGANFQQNDAQIDLAQVRKIAGLGAELRVSLSKVHLAELRNALANDPLDRVLKFLQIGDHYTPLADRLP